MATGIIVRGTKDSIAMILIYGSLVSMAMHINPSTNNIGVGHVFQWDNHYCYTC
jgi:hypothetical protein